jgi:hypothetical protein
MPAMQGGLRLAADIGGTFTDIAAFDETTGALTFGKALSTPAHLVEGISAGVVKAGSDYRSAALFLHGSTIAINTMLERTGAHTALLVTEGFRDIYEIGRINRPDAYNLFFQKHVPLIERALRFEVHERTLADGEIDKPLDDGEIAALGAALERLGVEAVAILFLNCYANADHERRAKAILEKQPSEIVRVGVARIVAGIPRVRALRDGRGQCLYRPERSAAISARSTRTCAAPVLPARFWWCSRPAGFMRPGKPGTSACACWNRDRPLASSARRRCVERSRSKTPSPSTWAAPRRRRASSIAAKR